VHGELGNRFYLLFCDDERKRRMVSTTTRETERKDDEKCALEKCARSRGRDETSRARTLASREKIHSKTRSSRRVEISGPFPPSLPREMRILFSRRKPSLLKSVPKIEKRTRSSSRELHLIPTQVRIRFVHGIRLLFRFSFTHGAMIRTRSRSALLRVQRCARM